jgi:phosphate transport system substrate-binding protein
VRIARPLLALAAPLFWAGSAPANICAPDLPRYRPQLLAFPANAPYTTADGRIRIVGYNDMAEMLTALGRIFERAHPGFHFDLVLRGTRTAPSALTDGTSLFAPMGAEFEDKDLAAYQRVYGEQPLLIRIAHDSLNPLAKSSPVGIFVHSTNPLSTLSIENARRIFTRSDNSARHWADWG